MPPEGFPITADAPKSQGLHAFVCTLAGDQGRQDDDLAGRAQAEPPQGLETRHFRHVDIQEDRVGIELPYLLDGDAAVLRGIDDLEIGIAVDDLLDQLTHDEAVVDDEDALAFVPDTGGGKCCHRNVSR